MAITASDATKTMETRMPRRARFDDTLYTEGMRLAARAIEAWEFGTHSWADLPPPTTTTPSCRPTRCTSSSLAANCVECNTGPVNPAAFALSAVSVSGMFGSLHPYTVDFSPDPVH